MSYFKQVINAICFTIFFFMLIAFASGNAIYLFSNTLITLMGFIVTIIFSFLELEIIKY